MWTGLLPWKFPDPVELPFVVALQFQAVNEFPGLRKGQQLASLIYNSVCSKPVAPAFPSSILTDDVGLSADR